MQRHGMPLPHQIPIFKDCPRPAFFKSRVPRPGASLGELLACAVVVDPTCKSRSPRRIIGEWASEYRVNAEGYGTAMVPRSVLRQLEDQGQPAGIGAAAKDAVKRQDLLCSYMTTNYKLDDGKPRKKSRSTSDPPVRAPPQPDGGFKVRRFHLLPPDLVARCRPASLEAARVAMAERARGERAALAGAARKRRTRMSEKVKGNCIGRILGLTKRSLPGPSLFLALPSADASDDSGADSGWERELEGAESAAGTPIVHLEYSNPLDDSWRGSGPAAGVTAVERALGDARRAVAVALELWRTGADSTAGPVLEGEACLLAREAAELHKAVASSDTTLSAASAGELSANQAHQATGAAAGSLRFPPPASWELLSCPDSEESRSQCSPCSPHAAAGLGSLLCSSKEAPSPLGLCQCCLHGANDGCCPCMG